jgi:DNA-binding CsgD family transcriptional regulator
VAALPLWREVGSQEMLAEWLAGVATLAVACRAPRQAARLFGAAEALRDALGHAFVPPEGTAFERGADTARAALGDAAYAAGRDAGRALPVAQAIEEASAFLSDVGGPSRRLEVGDQATDAGLTPREAEVLRLLVDGLSDREIAAALFIGPRTVQTHVANLFNKLSVHTRAEAAAVAVRRGLV